MTDQPFAAQLQRAIATARRQYEAYEEASAEEVARMVDAFGRELERLLPLAATESDGLLRYSKPKAASYLNDCYCLSMLRPNGRPYALFFEAIGHDRVQWRLNSSLDSWGGGYQWLNVDELRQAEAFIRGKILELVARLADPV